MVTRADVDPMIGEMVIDAIRQETGLEVEVILIVLPRAVDGQPSFVTSIPPEMTEDIICQIAAQMTPEMKASRKVVEAGKVN